MKTFLSRLALACAALWLGVLPAAAQMATSGTALSATAWTTLGTAPLLVENPSNYDVRVAAGTACPASGVVAGHQLLPGMARATFGAAGQTVCARLASAGAASVVATTASTGGAATAVSTVSAGGGVASFSRLPSSAATTNATLAKNAPGRVYKIVACNTTTTHARIKLYDSATTPVPGTTTVKFTRPLPAAAASGGLACAAFDVSDIGWSFANGIGWALTAGAADNDNTAVAAGAITDVSVEYQ